MQEKVETIKVFRLIYEGYENNPCYCETLRQLQDTLESVYTDEAAWHEIGEKVTIDITTMPRDKYVELPEWELQ